MQRITTLKHLNPEDNDTNFIVKWNLGRDKYSVYVEEGKKLSSYFP